MKPNRWSSSLVLCAWLCAAPLVAAAEDEWTASVATTTIRFDDGLLRSLGMRRVDDEPTATSSRFAGSSYASTPASELRFQSIGGDFENFEAGSLFHRGGFGLVGDRLPEPISLRGFELRVADGPAVFDLLDAQGRRWFTVHNMQFVIVPHEQRLFVLHAGVYLSPELRAAMGYPDDATVFAGELNIELPALVPPALRSRRAGFEICEADFEPPVDVELTGINQVAQGAREPGVRVAMAPSALLQNVGEGSIRWGEAIGPVAIGEVDEHPMLSLAFYRLHDGRIEQLGLADVKHAFRAINNDCVCRPGNVFYPGCTDVYGVTTNLDRRYLGPREEVTASTGDWTRVGSHFDQCLALGPIDPSVCVPGPDDVDDRRDHQGEANGYHDDFQHRLWVPEAELATQGALYFIEAWYVVAGDTELSNSLGHRRVSPSLSFDAWTFPFQSDLRLGSILGQVEDAGGTRALVDTADGRLELAVTTTDLGDGTTRYEYALMNFDFDRRIDRFSIPNEAGVSIGNPSHSGIAARPGSGWTSEVTDDAISFTAPPGEEIDWGMLHRFGFEADREPVETYAAAQPSEAGSGGEIALATRGPVAAPEPRAHAMTAAVLLGLAFLRGRRATLRRT